jgi:hypothetical protein
MPPPTTMTAPTGCFSAIGNSSMPTLVGPAASCILVNWEMGERFTALLHAKFQQKNQETPCRYYSQLNVAGRHTHSDRCHIYNGFRSRLWLFALLRERVRASDTPGVRQPPCRLEQTVPQKSAAHAPVGVNQPVLFHAGRQGPSVMTGTGPVLETGPVCL